MTSEPQLEQALDAAARAIVAARHVVALVGAGISVESGIPPFRGPGGLWTKYGEPDFLDYERFSEDPKKWWEDRISRSGTIQELIDALVTSGYSPSVVRMVDDRQDYDLYDVLAELGWGMNPRTRRDRTLAFTYKHEDWINALPGKTAATVRAIASQFDRGGTEGLENPQIFQTPEVKAAGGLPALRLAGNPRALLIETKARMFAA